MPAVIRAVDHVAPPLPVSDGDHRAEAVTLPERTGLLQRLFGITPDYTQPALEALWQESLGEDDLALFEECRRLGVDVLDDDGQPVSAWRDILVLLRARARGILRAA